jgi:DNA-binding FadR family transcriptional regulator
VRIPPRVAEVAGEVRKMIDGGTLKPGEAAPTGAALREMTGAGLTQCLMALRVLETEGTLVAQTSPKGKVRIVQSRVADYRWLQAPGMRPR